MNSFYTADPGFGLSFNFVLLLKPPYVEKNSHHHRVARLQSWKLSLNCNNFNLTSLFSLSFDSKFDEWIMSVKCDMDTQIVKDETST